MFKYIRLQNYKSFTNLTFDFNGKNDIPKKLIILYGENGAGKSNIISVFDTLFDTFQTLKFKSYMIKYIEDHKGITEERLNKINAYIDIARIIDSNKTIGSIENMIIEIGFVIDNKNGSYTIEFDDSHIVHEKLEFVLNKNKVVYFDFDKNDKKVNESIFSAKYRESFLDSIGKYWGKHSAISVLFNDCEEYTDDYVVSAMDSSLIRVLKYLDSIACYLVENDSISGFFSDKFSLLNNYERGVVSEKNENLINVTEKIISDFFTGINRDIKGVFYRRDYKNKKIKYELFFKKAIAGDVKEISYKRESCGTRNLLDLLRFFLAAADGFVAAIDEVDNGIHDVLLVNLMKQLQEKITGQLILTTHNTMLLDEYSFKDSIYFIVMDENGNKTIKPMTGFDFRVQQNSNILSNYLKGTFGGAPWNDICVDFDVLKEMTHEYMPDKKE